MKAYIMDRLLIDHEITLDNEKLMYNEVLNGNSQAGTIDMYSITQEIIDENFELIDIIEEGFGSHILDAIVTDDAQWAQVSGSPHDGVDVWTEIKSRGGSQVLHLKDDNAAAGKAWGLDYTFPTASNNPPTVDDHCAWDIELGARTSGGANYIYFFAKETTANIRIACRVDMDSGILYYFDGAYISTGLTLNASAVNTMKITIKGVGTSMFTVNGADSATVNNNANWAGAWDIMYYQSTDAHTDILECWVDNIDISWLPSIDDIDYWGFVTTGVVYFSVQNVDENQKAYMCDTDGANIGIGVFTFPKSSPDKPVGESIKFKITVNTGPAYISIIQDTTVVIQIEFDTGNDINIAGVDTTANWVVDTELEIEVVFVETGKCYIIVDTTTYDNSGAYFLNNAFITGKLTSMRFVSDVAALSKFYIDDIYLSWTNIQEMSDFKDKYLRFTNDAGGYLFAGYVKQVQRKKRNRYHLQLKDIGLLLEKNYGYSYENHDYHQTTIDTGGSPLNSPTITVVDGLEPNLQRKVISVSLQDTVKKYIRDDPGPPDLESLEVDSFTNKFSKLRSGAIGDLDSKGNDAEMHFGSTHTFMSATFTLKLTGGVDGEINKVRPEWSIGYQGIDILSFTLDIDIEMYDYPNTRWVNVYKQSSIGVFHLLLSTETGRDKTSSPSRFINRVGLDDFALIRVTIGGNWGISADLFMKYLRVRVETTARPHDPFLGRIAKISGASNEDITIEFHPDIGGDGANPYAQDGDSIFVGDTVSDAIGEIVEVFDTAIVEKTDKAIFNDMRGSTLIQKLKFLASLDGGYWFWYLNSAGERRFHYLPRLNQILEFEYFLENDGKEITDLAGWTSNHDGVNLFVDISVTTTEGATLRVKSTSAIADASAVLLLARNDSNGLAEFEFSIQSVANEVATNLGSVTFLDVLDNIILQLYWDGSDQLRVVDAGGTTNYNAWVLQSNDFHVYKLIFELDNTFKLYGQKPGENIFTEIHSGSVDLFDFYDVEFVAETVSATTNEIKIGHLRYLHRRLIGEYDEEYVLLKKGDKLTTWTSWHPTAFDLYDGVDCYYHIVPSPTDANRNVLRIVDKNAATRFYIEKPHTHVVVDGDWIQFDIYRNGTDYIRLYFGATFLYEFQGDDDILAQGIDTGANLVSGWNTIKIERSDTQKSKLTLNGSFIGEFDHGVNWGNFIYLWDTSAHTNCDWYFDKWEFSWMNRKDVTPITAQAFGTIIDTASAFKDVTIRGQHQIAATSEEIVVPDPKNPDPSDISLGVPDSPRSAYIVDSRLLTAVGLKDKARGMLRNFSEDGFNIPFKIYEYAEDLILHVGDYINVTIYGKRYYNQIIRRLKCTYDADKNRNGQYEIEIGKSSTPALEKVQRNIINTDDDITSLNITGAP